MVLIEDNNRNLCVMGTWFKMETTQGKQGDGEIELRKQ